MGQLEREAGPSEPRLVNLARTSPWTFTSESQESTKLVSWGVIVFSPGGAIDQSNLLLTILICPACFGSSARTLCLDSNKINKIKYKWANTTG